MRTFAALAVAVVPLIACTPAFTYTKLNDPPHAMSPRRVEDVQVFEGQPGGTGYVEVGFIEAHKETFGGSGETSPRRVQLFREKAAELGCELIVFHSRQPVNAGVASSNKDRVACVVYR